MEVPPTFIDDHRLLQVMLERDEQGQLANMSGEQLLEAYGGSPGLPDLRAAFVRELQIAAEDGLISFAVGPVLRRPLPEPHEYSYLQDLRNLRLRTAGRDRARGEIVRVPMPEPNEDDGRNIPRRVVERLARDCAVDLAGDEARSFLHDAGIPDEHLPPFAGDPADYIRSVLVALLDRGSAGRRLVRQLAGRWLSDRLDVGPTPEQRAELVAALGRVGWSVTRGTLVVGERVRPAPPAPATAAPLDRVVRLCRRFPQVVRQLEERHSDRPALRIEDEYDTRDLLHALLRLEFDDVRHEFWNPQFAGAASRADLLLPEAGILIELKFARSTTTKRIFDELMQDITRYGDPQANHGAGTLLCFIYDPDSHLGNRAGIEADLARAGNERLRVAAVIA